MVLARPERSSQPNDLSDNDVLKVVLPPKASESGDSLRDDKWVEKRASETNFCKDFKIDLPTFGMSNTEQKKSIVASESRGKGKEAKMRQKMLNQMVEKLAQEDEKLNRIRSGKLKAARLPAPQHLTDGIGNPSSHSATLLSPQLPKASLLESLTSLIANQPPQLSRFWIKGSTKKTPWR